MPTFNCRAPQRRRGKSFVREYMHRCSPFSIEKNHDTIRCACFFFGDNNAHCIVDKHVPVPLPLVSPKPPHLKGKLTVVLDLDETLVYARKGPLFVRPGLKELMSFLNANCETIVWTAGAGLYAMAVLNEIDPDAVVSYTIARTSPLSLGRNGEKDLKLLGRDLAEVLCIENTPDSIRRNISNSILVEDYVGGELEDTTLFALIELLQDLVECLKKGISVSQFIKTSSRVFRVLVPTDARDMLQCYCLRCQSTATVQQNC